MTTTLKPIASKQGGTGHLSPAEKKRLREERAARRAHAVALAKSEAASKAKYAKPDGANRQTDPVDPGFARPSNADDQPAPRPSKSK